MSFALRFVRLIQVKLPMIIPLNVSIIRQRCWVESEHRRSVLSTHPWAKKSVWTTWLIDRWWIHAMKCKHSMNPRFKCWSVSRCRTKCYFVNFSVKNGNRPHSFHLWWTEWLVYWKSIAIFDLSIVRRLTMATVHHSRQSRLAEEMSGFTSATQQSESNLHSSHQWWQGSICSKSITVHEDLFLDTRRWNHDAQLFVASTSRCYFHSTLRSRCPRESENGWSSSTLRICLSVDCLGAKSSTLRWRTRFVMEASSSRRSIILHF